MTKPPLQRRPLAAYRLRRQIDGLDREMDRLGRRNEGDPLFERALEIYPLWAELAYPGTALATGRQVTGDAG